MNRFLLVVTLFLAIVVLVALCNMPTPSGDVDTPPGAPAEPDAEVGDLDARDVTATAITLVFDGFSTQDKVDICITYNLEPDFAFDTVYASARDGTLISEEEYREVFIERMDYLCGDLAEGDATSAAEEAAGNQDYVGGE